MTEVKEYYTINEEHGKRMGTVIKQAKPVKFTILLMGEGKVSYLVFFKDENHKARFDALMAEVFCDALDCGQLADKESYLSKSQVRIYLCDQCFTRFARRGLLQTKSGTIVSKDIDPKGVKDVGR